MPTPRGLNCNDDTDRTRSFSRRRPLSQRRYVHRKSDELACETVGLAVFQAKGHFSNLSKGLDYFQTVDAAIGSYT